MKLFLIVGARPSFMKIAPLMYALEGNKIIEALLIHVRQFFEVLNIHCLTVCPTTERPITIWEGSNKLIKVNDIVSEVDLILQGKGKKGNIPKYWDGKTAQRILNIITNKI